MLKVLYSFVTPWALANKHQIIKNRVLGVIADFIYRIYIHIIPIKQAKVKKDDVIVSLTTFPGRIHHVYYTLQTLLRQNVLPEKTILWLAKEQFPKGEDGIPRRILKLKQKGLTIRFCEDYRSYKKIVPIYQECVNKIIVTADDDALYPEDWLEMLLDKYDNHQGNVVCYRAHKITLINNEIASYKKWIGLSPGTLGPSITLMPVGVGGVLYPPNYFENVEFDYSIIKKLAPTTDDIWLKVIGLVKNIKVVKVYSDSKEWFTVKGSQKKSLRSINVDNSNANDAALKNLFDYYELNMSCFQETEELKS